ncbi:MAG: PP2C family protein-serine/threonine phosphatase [Acidobacteriota bacterium]
MRRSKTGYRNHTLAPESAPKSLFRKVERTLSAIERGEDILATIQNVAEYMVTNFRDDLGIIGGRLYRRSDEGYELVGSFGAASPPPGTIVPHAYAPIEAAIDSGVVVMDRASPGLDPELEALLGTRERFAAIALADGDYLISFDVAPGRAPERDLRASLNIVRLAINQKLRQERFEEILEDALRIQTSILPKRTPAYADFDIGGGSRAAEVVGGDFYDYIPITAHLFDLVIADASGHGLPAALQVRDVYMGLRMGLSRDYKVSRTVERLNSIINRSKLATKFVSLFVAELETNGSIIYVNAGHPPPFLLHADGSLEYLREGGMVLGPMPDVAYLRGFARLEPGATLVMYTDGITECHDHLGKQQFGLRRFQRLVRRLHDRPAQEIVAAVFEALDRFAGRSIPEDDQTMVVVRRPAMPAGH